LKLTAVEGDILQNILETQSNKHPEKLNQIAKTFQVKIKKPRTLISPKREQTNKPKKKKENLFLEIHGDRYEVSRPFENLSQFGEMIESLINCTFFLRYFSNFDENFEIESLLGCS
jgi:hypothetical protein